MIEFQNVSKIYKGGKVAVENVNISFEKANSSVLSVQVGAEKPLRCGCLTA